MKGPVHRASVPGAPRSSKQSRRHNCLSSCSYPGISPASSHQHTVMDRKLPTDPAMLHNRGEKVSTERRTEKVSTEPPGILRDPSMSSTGTGRKNSGVAPRRYNTDIPVILPHERVFPIQIGSELFRLSGASLSSDGM